MAAGYFFPRNLNNTMDPELWALFAFTVAGLYALCIVYKIKQMQ